MGLSQQQRSSATQPVQGPGGVAACAAGENARLPCNVLQLLFLNRPSDSYEAVSDAAKQAEQAQRYTIQAYLHRTRQPLELGV